MPWRRASSSFSCGPRTTSAPRRCSSCPLGASRASRHGTGEAIDFKLKGVYPRRARGVSPAAPARRRRHLHQPGNPVRSSRRARPELPLGRRLAAWREVARSASSATRQPPSATPRGHRKPISRSERQCRSAKADRRGQRRLVSRESSRRRRRRERRARRRAPSAGASASVARLDGTTLEPGQELEGTAGALAETERCR